MLDAPRSRVGESPLWSVGDQALYWVDIPQRRLQRWDATHGSRAWDCEQELACIGLHAAGGLIAGMETGVFQLQIDGGGALRTRLLHAVQHARDGMRMNDGRCDRAGRFWLSSMVRDMSLAAPDGVLYRVDASGLSTHVAGLVTGNGLAFSPDGRRMYLSDSHPSVRQIWSYALDADGVPTDRQPFVDMRQHPGRPDGAAVDVDGCYWTCANDGGALLRFTPQGALDRSIPLPVSKPSMCAFGGAGLDQLFVTSIQPQMPVAGFDAALDGAVLVLRPGVQGLAELPFGLAGPVQLPGLMLGKH